MVDEDERPAPAGNEELYEVDVPMFEGVPEVVPSGELGVVVDVVDDVAAISFTGTLPLPCCCPAVAILLFGQRTKYDRPSLFKRMPVLSEWRLLLTLLLSTVITLRDVHSSCITQL